MQQSLYSPHRNYSDKMFRSSRSLDHFETAAVWNLRAAHRKSEAQITDADSATTTTLRLLITCTALTSLISRGDSMSAVPAQEWTNRNVIGHEPLICSKMCFTQTESIQ